MYKFQAHIALVFIIAILLNACGSTAPQAAADDPLRFPADEFTVKTKTVDTTEGVREVTYRSYMHIPYVSNPVDVNYQSLNVSVPIEIDGKAVDATNAPILFANTAGGYMSSINVTSGTDGQAPGPTGAAGGPGGPGGRMGGPPGGGQPGGGGNAVNGNQDLALAAGYVLVEPGCRGRENQADDGSYCGKAPAPVVDLKAAIRYVRYNRGIIPGNVDWIVSTGCSAGGNYSAIIGTSGGSPMYDAYLKEIGAADADDTVFACASYSPGVDMEHGDLGYEWMYGASPLDDSGELVDQALSKELKDAFGPYQASLGLKGRDGFGTLTADNYDAYLMKYFLIPSANKYLMGLTDEKRTAYLSVNPWIAWHGNSASFAFKDYVAHVGRQKSLPANDVFDLTGSKTILFGNETTNARHFTNFSLRKTTGDPTAVVSDELQTVVHMMNPLYFIGQENPGCAQYWWIRHGTDETGTATPIVINMATGLENLGKHVNAWLYWDGGHCSNDDPEDLMAWIGEITGYSR
jgi:hypothetical protein